MTQTYFLGKPSRYWIRLERAACNLIDDVKKRYPGERLFCPVFRELDLALLDKQQDEKKLARVLEICKNAAKACPFENGRRCMDKACKREKSCMAVLETIAELLDDPLPHS